MVIAVFSLCWYQSMQFNIREYGSSAKPIRAALLKAVPIGSSLDDVYEFMEKENIPNASGGCGYSELQDDHVSLIACTGPFSGMWLIHFIFDENELLENIEIIGYYP
jgi:hypothetical protein